MPIKRYSVTHESGLTGQLYERPNGEFVKVADLAMVVTFDDAPQAAQVDRTVEGMKNPPKLVFEDECGANMNGHSFGPHGPNGEQQCQWCGQAKLPTDLVLRITTAYEQGFGHATRTELSNPYSVGTPEHEAWDHGREIGLQRLPDLDVPL